MVQDCAGKSHMSDIYGHLELCNHEYMVEDIVLVSKLLGMNTTTTSVNLANNLIGDNEGAVSLAEALINNSAITQLDLSNTGLQAKAAALFANVVSETRTLAFVDLRSNFLGVEGTTMVVDAEHNNFNVKWAECLTPQVDAAQVDDDDPNAAEEVVPVEETIAHLSSVEGVCGIPIGLLRQEIDFSNPLNTPTVSALQDMDFSGKQTKWLGVSGCVRLLA
jgi:hypothetical protein